MAVLLPEAIFNPLPFFGDSIISWFIVKARKEKRKYYVFKEKLIMMVNLQVQLSLKFPMA